MAALAAVIDTGAVGDKSISLFYNTSGALFALSLKSSTDNDNETEDTWETADDHYNRYILNPSSIAAAYYRGLKFVVAMTMPKQGDPESDVQISLISPICQKLLPGTFENNHVGLGTTPDGNEGWLYYLVDVSNNVKNVMEFDLGTRKSVALNAITQVMNNSSLAAWYDPEQSQRHIIYEAGAILDYAVGALTPVTLPISDFARNSSLAVTYSSSTKKTYLYYYDVYQALKRCTYSGSSWALPEAVPGAPPSVAENSQITVVEANGSNHVFYIAKDMGQQVPEGQSPFTHILDTVS
ncbi:uncharacterized protein F4812DRAFT_458133 [Daldinia caldariorum]|uniref:uncharacterized protein n=1 Tax=Daldinia caldariorum TaxID=326644 RepID=UPI00200757FE|nr:uncharacterized protein F4812DRAFT_458133 [Daldinia caldariorum]KAI1468605.1 hypothetical protein F4812DRAFT_458133 [Daldinia caldariorum]